MKCGQCNNQVSPGSKFCSHCGARFVSQGKSCSNSDCGKTGLPDEALFCPDCGTRLVTGVAISAKGINNNSVKISTPVSPGNNTGKRDIPDDPTKKTDSSPINESIPDWAKVMLTIVVVGIVGYLLGADFSNTYVRAAAIMGGSRLAYDIWK